MTRFKRWLASLAVGLLVITGVLVVTEAPAAAAPYCPPNYACLYENQGGGGSSISFYYSPYSCIYLGGGFNDRASSVRNETPIQIKFRDNFDCTGSYVAAGAACGGCLGSYINDLAGWPYFFNDRVSAIQFY
jgi:hypothetical protein